MQIWNIEQEKDKEKERVGGRPAKLNEKKRDRDLEWEIKNKGDFFLLEEQDENFVAVVTKWEMLAANNARRKWAAVKKSGQQCKEKMSGSEIKKNEREHVRHFLHNNNFSGSFAL